MSWQQLSKHMPGIAWMVGGFGAACVYSYPHTLGIEKYKESIMDTSKDSSHNIDAELLLANEINSHFKWRVSTFRPGPGLQLVLTKQPLELSHKGSVKTIWGAVVGFPILFTASSLEAARENPAAYLTRYNISVDSSEGQQILDLCTLSPAAKKFALAREMYHANSLQIHTNFCGISISTFSCYAIAHTLSNFIPVQAAKVIPFLTIVPLLGYIYVKTYDMYNCYIHAKSDRKVAGIDQSVANGGVEYYTTLIACREALKKAQKEVTINDESRSMFDMSWRKRELSLEEKRDRLTQVSRKLYS